MHRRALALPALLVVAAIAVGACGTAAPALSDPTEILTKAVESIQNAKTVHMEATVEGSVKLDLSGTGQAGDISLVGTKMALDVDVEHSNAKVNLAIPAILGMTIDVIVVGQETYTKVSLIGDKYQKGTTADTGLPVDAADPAQSLKDLQDWLKKPEVAPTKEADVSCGSKSCYQVKIDLTADELAALIPEASGASDTAVALTVLVEKDTTRPASLSLNLNSSDLGNVTVTLTLSKWDESLDIKAPPADQVE